MIVSQKKIGIRNDAKLYGDPGYVVLVADIDQYESFIKFDGRFTNYSITYPYVYLHGSYLDHS